MRTYTSDASLPVSSSTSANASSTEGGGGTTVVTVVTAAAGPTGGSERGVESGGARERQGFGGSGWSGFTGGCFGLVCRMDL